MTYYYNVKSLRGFFQGHSLKILFFTSLSFLLYSFSFSQNQVSGEIKDENTGAPIVGARVMIKNTQTGGFSDAKGVFSIKAPSQIPFVLEIVYIGYDTITQEVNDLSKPLKFSLVQSAVNLEEVQITTTALSERQQQSALTVESMGIKAIKETPAANFYEGLSHLKGVDLNSASFGFKVINTRGFNSTQPVRSLQLIDGVDNQSPGLNFSLGNFLGASELDIETVDLVVGASSAFYGPNAFNGVIAMKTKNPFIHRGVSVSIKGGERNWLESAIRVAKVFKNKKGEEKFAMKLNLFYLRADDWEADNFNETYRDTTEENAIDYVGEDNPGGYDAVNIYGDEVFGIADELGGDLIQRPGLGKYYRTGYKEKDLLDYDTRNVKAAIAFHYKLKPNVELIAGSNYSNGTTVFQGINRISLKDIQFFQHKLQLQGSNGTDKYFARVYMTHEDAGNSYDPVFTAFRLQSLALNDIGWRQGYQNRWSRDYVSRVKKLEGYPDPPNFQNGFKFNFAQQARVLEANNDQLTIWHQEVRDAVDGSRLVPGTPEFQTMFDSIRSVYLSNTGGGGTRFFDKSALYHGHAEYKFVSDFAEITVGGNGRIYTPVTNGSIFDDADTTIINHEFGVYAGIRKKLISDRLTLTATLRLDKNQNFQALLSPALTGAFNLNESNTIRASVSSAIRNPTLADQYLNYNVGSALLVGNITGYDSLITLESLRLFLNTRDAGNLEYFDIAPIRPEKVTTIEIGYRGLIKQKLYIDANYYFSRYQDFIGFQLGFNGIIQFAQPIGSLYRVSANAQDIVTTQGASIGFNYFINEKFSLGGNYSWNVLNTTTDDPIVPAYNTPEHKFNVNIGGRDFSIFGLDKFGFNTNFKWVEGFIFEGSPQFTGIVPTYYLLDAQINKEIPEINAIVKVGASNILNNKVYTVYGGPRIGRLAYASITFNFDSFNFKDK